MERISNTLGKIREKVALLKKQGGFEVLKGIIDGKKGIREIDPKDEARRMAFLTDMDKAHKREKLSNELIILREVVASDDPHNLCYEQYKKIDHILNENLSVIFEDIKDLEKSYHCLDLFFRNAGLDEVDNFHLINMPIEDFCTPALISYEELLYHLKNKFEGFSLKDNYGLVVAPGYLGEGLDSLSDLASTYHFVLVTDCSDETDIDDLIDLNEESRLRGSKKSQAHTVVACNRIATRKKNERIESENLFIPASPALAGKLYANRRMQAVVGKTNGKLEGVVDTRMHLTRSDLIKINMMSFVPIVFIDNLGAVIMSDNTLATYHENTDLQRLAVVRARNWIAKTILHYLNNHPFKVLDSKLRNEIMRDLNKFFKRISTENGLVDEYDIEPIEVSNDYIQAVRIMIKLIFKTTKQPYAIEFIGKAHSFEVIEHEA